MTGPAKPLSLDLRGRFTLTVTEAGELLGLGRDSTYSAIERGEIGHHKHGRRIVVPTYSLLREQLGLPEDVIARALGLESESTNDELTTSSPSASIHVLATKTGDPQYANDDPA